VSLVGGFDETPPEAANVKRKTGDKCEDNACPDIVPLIDEPTSPDDGEGAAHEDETPKPFEDSSLRASSLRRRHRLRVIAWLIRCNSKA
jgi:hypothetical protein